MNNKQVCVRRATVATFTIMGLGVLGALLIVGPAIAVMLLVGDRGPVLTCGAGIFTSMLVLAAMIWVGEYVRCRQ